MIRRSLSLFWRLARRHRYAQTEVGAGATVDFWKLRPCGRNALIVGTRSMLASRVVFERQGARLSVGSRTFVGLGIMSIAESVSIGDDVMISWGSTIVDHHSHSLRFRERMRDVQHWIEGEKIWTGIRIAPVTIGDKAWLGFNVSVLPGVTIGEGAVIGACSLVTKDIPAWTVAAGNPARVLRELSAEERA